MLEKKHEPLLSTRQFVLRFLRSILLGLLMIAAAQLFGMWGYHYFEGFSWVDSFVNAAMILSGMGPLNPLQTEGGKIFAGFYALFSGLAFIVVLGVIFAPLVHRFMHKFHIYEDSRSN